MTESMTETAADSAAAALAARLSARLSYERVRTLLQELLRVPSPQTELLEAEGVAANGPHGGA
jgi:hypothetical protein